jgi:hypothetical protein
VIIVTFGSLPVFFLYREGKKRKGELSFSPLNASTLNLRYRQRQTNLSLAAEAWAAIRLPQLYPENISFVTLPYQESELWEIIEALLPGEKEKRMAFLHFHCNLKAREIIRYCPGEFSCEDEIYRLKRNVMGRILRNADKIRWRLSSNE